MDEDNNSTPSNPLIQSEPLAVLPISQMGPSTAINSGVAGEGGAHQPPAKRKRGRPRKYDMLPPGVVGSLHPAARTTIGVSRLLVDGDTPPIKRGRGRPKGSVKSVSCLLAEWMGNLASLEPEEQATKGIIRHVDMKVLPGEDIAKKIVSFVKNTTKAVLILSASGNISTAVLQRPYSSNGLLRYEGNFRVLKLNGSIRRDHMGRRTGAVSVSLECQHEGRILGGAVGGSLIAADDFELVLGTFKQDLGGKKVKPTKASDPGSGFNPPEVQDPVPLRCALVIEEDHHSITQQAETPLDSPAQKEGSEPENPNWDLVPRNPNSAVTPFQSCSPSCLEATDDPNNVLIPNPNFNRMNFSDHQV